MQIEIKRKEKREVEVTIPMKFVTYWVVRIIRVGAYDNKECIAEVEYSHKPNEQEIANALIEYNNKKVFASISENYRLEEISEGK